MTLTNGEVKEGDKPCSKPHGVALDSKQNVLVTDTGNNRICKIFLDQDNIQKVNKIEVIVAEDKGLNHPTSIVTDDDKIFVADTGNNSIKEINGQEITEHKDENEALVKPEGIAIVSNDKLVISDTGNNCVREMEISSGNEGNCRFIRSFFS